MDLTMNSTYKWEKEYPPNCPTSKATNLTMVVYRFVTNNPPTEDDFLPYEKLYPGQYSTCNAWGISFFQTEGDMRKQNKNPCFKNKYIAKGQIETTDGSVIISQSGHINLWMYEGNDIHTKFRII